MPFGVRPDPKDNFEMPGRFAATIECADDLMAEEIIERALRLGVDRDGWRFRELVNSARNRQAGPRSDR